MSDYSMATTSTVTMAPAQIRPADRGDTRFLAWVMQEAARSHCEKGIFDVMVPEDRARLDFLDAASRTKTRGFFHHSGFLIAEIDGRMAAAMTGFDGADAEERIGQSTIEAADLLGWEPRALEEMNARTATIAGAFGEFPEDRFVIEFVATLPELRGRGIVSQLMDAMLSRARDLGHEKAQIGYLIGNTPAARLYQRIGFETVAEHRDPGFEAAIRSPGIATMHMDLRKSPTRS